MKREQITHKPAVLTNIHHSLKYNLEYSLETSHLILQPVNDSHRGIYQQILSSDELTQHLPKGRAHTEDEITLHVNNRIKHWQEHGFGSYVIFAKENPSQAIGYVGIEVCPRSDYSDIRYAIVPCAQGKGYVFEASQKVIATTFALNKHKKIYGCSLPDNHASVYLLKKLGMQPETNNPYDIDELVCFSLMHNSHITPQ